jgi:hypothetical protein
LFDSRFLDGTSRSSFIKTINHVCKLWQQLVPRSTLCSRPNLMKNWQNQIIVASRRCHAPNSRSVSACAAFSPACPTAVAAPQHTRAYGVSPALWAVCVWGSDNAFGVACCCSSAWALSINSSGLPNSSMPLSRPSAPSSAVEGHAAAAAALSTTPSASACAVFWASANAAVAAYCAYSCQSTTAPTPCCRPFVGCGADWLVALLGN